MKLVAVFALVCVTVALARPRVKRQAYQLPADAELIVGNIQTSFDCQGYHYGYYADVGNDCKVFHVCQEVTDASGATQTYQWSFFCGNQTIFNQLTLTCTWPDEAVNCADAPKFYYVNDNIGIPDAHFLTNDDVESAKQYIPSYGARTGKK